MLDIRTKVTINWNPSDLYDRTEKAEEQWLFKAGGYLRSTIRRLIRRVKDGNIVQGKKKAPAGHPPFSHQGRGVFVNLRDSILFAVDKTEGDVAVGPVKQQELVGNLHEFGGKRRVVFQTRQNKTYSIGDVGPVSTRKFNFDVPRFRMHDQRDPIDGSVVVRVRLTTQHMADHANRLEKRLNAKYFAAQKNASYPARPFMQPGLMKAAPKLDDFWFNTIKE